jgi:hypothetical protein
MGGGLGSAAPIVAFKPPVAGMPVALWLREEESNSRSEMTTNYPTSYGCWEMFLLFFLISRFSRSVIAGILGGV